MSHIAPTQRRFVLFRDESSGFADTLTINTAPCAALGPTLILARDACYDGVPCGSGEALRIPATLQGLTFLEAATAALRAQIDERMGGAP
jgi:hypothetical protein